ncbi:Imm26 family immunity protein [Serratia fonticola]
MSEFKLWGWDKKSRTMLRFIKPGDIFCFRLCDKRYSFGRIVSKIMTGHVAEFFDFISDSPEIKESDINKANRAIDLVVIDTYSLFDKKVESNSEWRIIGHQENYIPNNVENTYFSYGVGNSCKKVNVFGDEESITEDEAKTIPELTPLRYVHIKKLIEEKVD